jgi:hypothetical protein
MITYEVTLVGGRRVRIEYQGTSVEAGWLFVHANYEVDRLCPRGPSVSDHNVRTKQ